MSGAGDVLAFCPSCLAENGFEPVNRRNPWEWTALVLAGKAPFRCRGCGSRQILSKRRLKRIEIEEPAKLADSQGPGTPAATGPVPVETREPSPRREDADFESLIREIRRAERAKDQDVFERRR